MHRRQVLKLGALALPFVNFSPAFGQSNTAPPMPLGRVNIDGWAIRSAPKFTARVLQYAQMNHVIPLLSQVTGDPFGAHKNVDWYETKGGYIHSAQVQPVSDRAQSPQEFVAPKTRFLGEVSVPIADVYAAPAGKVIARNRIYHGCTLRLDDAVRAADGSTWYRIAGGVMGGGYMKAVHIRQVLPSDLAPISPTAANKRVHVDMTRSVVIAYEGNSAVYTARCATGSRKNNAFTPAGNWPVMYKAASYHMTGDPKRGHTNWSYPAVPWVTYFSPSTGASLHGTYWHNDWGGWRSSGCVNLSNRDALWFYRWTNPTPPYDGGFWRTPDVSTATVITVQY